MSGTANVGNAFMNQLMSGMRLTSSVPSADSLSSAANTAPSTQQLLSRSVGDTVSLSVTTDEPSATSSTSTSPKKDGTNGTLAATTAYGSTVTLEAKESSSKRFSVGKAPSTTLFEASSDDQKGLTAWNMRNQGTDSAAFTATITTKNGKIETFDLVGNTAFTEDAYGTVAINEKAIGPGTITGTDANDILISLVDDTIVDAQAGDDVILNTGRRANLKGGTGDDSITSMGNGTVIEGNSGNDTISVLQDTLRQSLQRERSLEEQELVRKGLLRGASAQTISVDGGDGDDTIVVRPDIYQSTIKGGDGNDSLTVGDVYDSQIEGGNGRDLIIAKTLVKSLLDAGDGNDVVQFDKAVDSKIRLGGGDDVADIGVLINSSVSGGGGSDSVVIGIAEGAAFSQIENLRIRTYHNIIVDGVTFETGQNDTWINGTKEGNETLVDKTV